jgi:magnesium-transporting ATPase (P-type)
VISAEDLVPGDIVLIDAGSRVPADIRLLHSAALTADEALLTGESVPVKKSLEVLPPDTPLADRRTMLFAGTAVAGGRGIGIVIGTGMHTEIGAIVRAVAETASAKAPLLIRLEEFSRNVGIAIVVIGVLMGAVIFSRGASFFEVFFLAVALTVSVIPEGLPVAITAALSVASSRMAQRNVIVRRLAAVESLGSCTVIATDKTGTLTANQQTVRRVLIPDGSGFTVSGAGFSGSGKVEEENGAVPAGETLRDLTHLAEAGVLCNDGSLFRENHGNWIFAGDAMDVGLLAFGYKLGIVPDTLRNSVTRVGAIPYEPERRYAAVFIAEQERVRIIVKGASEAVLPYCAWIRINGQDEPFDPARIGEYLSYLTGSGHRVLAIAEGRLATPPPVDHELSQVAPELVLLGLVGFIDPVRPEVPDAIRSCQGAGIQVVMVTGDHPDTALAIAREIGIATTPDAVMTGAELGVLGNDPSAFQERIAPVRVFARVTPVEKLRIVDALVRSGHFVAVTGDGANDAPALQRANIGVAMGSGTDVTKDTASLIVTDDNFSSIVAGIEEGRFAYDNIRKVTYMLISTGFAEVAVFLLALIAGLPVPFLAVQLLWLNLVTNGIQDIGLAFESGEEGAMQRPPRDPREGIFNRLMIEEVLVSGVAIGVIAFAAWSVLLGNGEEEAHARNLLVLLMVLVENIHCLNCRSEYRSILRIPLRNNLYLIGAILAAQGIHIAAMQIPLLQGVLGIGPVSLAEWLILLALALAVLVIMESYKAFRRRFPDNIAVFRRAAERLS